MPQVTDQAELLRRNELRMVSKGPQDGAWRCHYIKCPRCGYFVLKGPGYDECPCGNVSIDSDMLRVSVQSGESEVECYDAIPRPSRREPRVTDVRGIAERVRRVASEGGLVSHMNDTKWRELCRAFHAWPIASGFRLCSLLAPPDYVHRWDDEWWYHPYPYVDIRWMEVRVPRESLSDALQMCKQIGAAVEVDGEQLKVWGWVGPADRPQFA